MSTNIPLNQAIDELGLTRLARALGVTHQAVRKWQKAGRLPRTEWTGETAYAEGIQRISGGKYSKDVLLTRVADQLTPQPQETRDAA